MLTLPNANFKIQDVLLMSVVIEVKGLGKKYRIGKAEQKADTIAGTLIKGLKQPFRNLKQIRSLSKLDEDEESIFWALRDVSFEVMEGEVLGIIGHNGAGKSTLLKILSRITEPSEGEVHIKGRVAALLEVGTGFHPELTGRENIYMNGTILGMRKKEIDHKLDEIVSFSGVEKYIDTPVKFYSSGMRVRLGFAVAAHLEPEILIIDEVLAVGDAEFQKRCLGKMEEVSKQGRTMLFVSHNMQAVQSLCKKSLVLKNGKIIFLGEASESVQFYLNQFSKEKRCLSDTDLEQPENDFVKFNYAKILNDGVITSRDEILFEFSFCCKFSSEAIVDVTFHLFDEMSNLVFVGTSGYDLNVKSITDKVVFRCRIPGNFLHHGYYKIGRILIVRNKGHVLMNLIDPLSFEIIPDNNGRFGWMGHKQGIVKPLLKWEVM